MLNMIRADLYRLRKSRTLLGIMIGWLIYLLLGSFFELSGPEHSSISIMSNDRMRNEVVFSANGSAFALQLLNSSIFLYYFVIPVVLFILISDFKWGTIKNIVPFKYSRVQIYLSKFIVAGIISALLPVAFCLLGLLVNQVFHGFSGIFRVEDFIKMSKIIGLQMPIMTGMAGVFLLVGLLLENGTAVAVSTIVYQMCVYMFAPMLSDKVYNTFFKFEPITCLSLTASADQLGRSDIAAILTSGIGLTAVALACGLLMFRRKSIR